MYRTLANEIADLLEKKRADYGDPNRTLGRFGVKGIAVRLNDKVERLINLTWHDNAKPHFESIEDTLMDIAGYAILALEILRRERDT
ncbi:nucleotide modification associated domain-containing protein [Desulfofundulus sp.]|uniref:nucleotide modification associated domain-containing protein n=1 Tax=Desulfofundulus sp. TaxID=2282750 RepID=UPI003C793B48